MFQPEDNVLWVICHSFPSKWTSLTSGFTDILLVLFVLHANVMKLWDGPWDSTWKRRRNSPHFPVPRELLVLAQLTAARAGIQTRKLHITNPMLLTFSNFWMFIMSFLTFLSCYCDRLNICCDYSWKDELYDKRSYTKVFSCCCCCCFFSPKLYLFIYLFIIPDLKFILFKLNYVFISQMCFPLMTLNATQSIQGHWSVFTCMLDQCRQEL